MQLIPRLPSSPDSALRRLSPRRPSARRGATLVYASIAFVALAAVGSLAVDYGRVQLASTELQNAADAASRYAAAGIRNRIDGQSAAASNAQAALTDLRVDGSPVSFNAGSDLELGIWNSTTKTFTVTTNASLANAVRVSLSHNVGGGAGAPPLTMLGLLGRSQCRVTADAVACIVTTGMNKGNKDGTFSYWVPATSNPWLAGMSKNTQANVGNPANNPDRAGKKLKDNGKRSDKPWLPSNNNGSVVGDIDKAYAEKEQAAIEAGGITVTSGDAISFANVNGGANNFGSDVRFTADGNLDWIVSNFSGSEHGKSDVLAPINSVVAVFLSEDTPSDTSPPDNLDFSSYEARNYAKIEPKLKQVFFIGDGLRDNGEPQQIVVPAGATRMFIGTMDGWEWNNNVGGFEVTAITATKVSTVR